MGTHCLTLAVYELYAEGCGSSYAPAIGRLPSRTCNETTLCFLADLPACLSGLRTCSLKSPLTACKYRMWSATESAVRVLDRRIVAEASRGSGVTYSCTPSPLASMVHCSGPVLVHHLQMRRFYCIAVCCLFFQASMFAGDLSKLET